MDRKFSALLVTAVMCLQVFPAMADSIQSRISAFEAEDCAPVVDAQLDSLSVDRSKITNIDYITIEYQSGMFGETLEYDAWVSFSTCKGNLLIKMDDACFEKNVFATGECRDIGIPTLPQK